MHEKVLPKRSRQFLDRLDKLKTPALKGWILAGGTGLALHLGHRVSDDFDFFRLKGMDVRRLREAFDRLGAYETLQEGDDTLSVLSHGIKVSFFQVRDPFLHAPGPYRFFAVADARDIALMKLAAISGRGSRKDFVDLYAILRGGHKLQECFAELPRKYGRGRSNAYHILKSLTYFEDAEQEPMPRVLAPFDWDECKAFFVREAHALVLP